MDFTDKPNANFTLEQLAATIRDRAGSNDDRSYTRRLVGEGRDKCAQKLGEEAVEAVIAAIRGNRRELVGEAADLLYHLLVLLEVSGVGLEEVMSELAGRTGRTGLEEKESR